MKFYFWVIALALHILLCSYTQSLRIRTWRTQWIVLRPNTERIRNNHNEQEHVKRNGRKLIRNAFREFNVFHVLFTQEVNEVYIRAHSLVGSLVDQIAIRKRFTRRGW